MDETLAEPQRRMLDLPTRGGQAALLDFGPADRPVDIVFSHANGFNARTYRSVLAPLAGELRIVAYDLRGHGRSTLPAKVEGREGWSAFADDVVALTEAVAQGPVVLAGHSMGATASLLAAARAPQLAKGLVLLDPVIFPGVHLASPNDMAGSPLAEAAARRRSVFDRRAEALEAYLGRGAFRTWSEVQLADYLQDGLVERADGRLELACAPAWEASNYTTHGYDPMAALEQVRCPVRILAAEQGSTARAGPVEVVPGTTHFLPMERPDVVQAALRAAAT
jgi:pimeloyl-ACP methyl ester carboxylesterase